VFSVLCVRQLRVKRLLRANPRAIVAATPNDLQHDRLLAAAAERRDGALCFDELLDNDAPGGDLVVDAALQLG